MKLFTQMPGVQGASSGGTAVFILPIGLSYEFLALTYVGITLAQMTNIRLQANGKPIQEFRTGTELDKLNQFDGLQAASGILMLYLNSFGMRTREAEEFTRLGTGMGFNDKPTVTDQSGKTIRNPLYNPYPINQLTLQIDCGATPTTFTLHALQSDPAPTGVIRKIRRFEYTAAGTTFELVDLPRGDLIRKLAISNPEVLQLEVKRDSVTVFDRKEAMNDLIQTNGIRTPLASWFIFDTSENGNAAEDLVTAGVNDLRFKITLSAAGALPLTVEYLGMLER